MMLEGRSGEEVRQSSSSRLLPQPWEHPGQMVNTVEHNSMSLLEVTTFRLKETSVKKPTDRHRNPSYKSCGIPVAAGASEENPNVHSPTSA